MSAIVDKADPLEPPAEPGLHGVRPGPGVRDRPGPGARPRPTSPGSNGSCPSSATRCSRARNSWTSTDAQRHAEGWCRTRAGLRTHGTTQCRPAELFALEEQPCLLAAPTSPYDLPVYATAQGAPGPPRRGGQGALLGAREPHRLPGRRPGRPGAGAHQPPRPAGQGPPPHGRRRAQHRPRRPAGGEDHLRPAGPRRAPADGRPPRPGHRRLRGRGAGAPAAVDQDAPGLRPVGAGEAVGRRSGSRRRAPGRWRPRPSAWR